MLTLADWPPNIKGAAMRKSLWSISHAMFLAAISAQVSGAPKDDHLAFIAQAKKAVADQMRDPDSVKFRDVALYRQLESKELALCGEFNAKNGYGAYVGYRRFYVSESGGAKLEPDDGDNDLFGVLRLSYCHAKVRAVN